MDTFHNTPPRTYKVRRTQGNWTKKHPFFDAVPQELILSICSLASKSAREQIVQGSRNKHTTHDPRMLRTRGNPSFRELLNIESFRLVCKKWKNACSPLFEKFLEHVIPSIVKSNWCFIDDWVTRGPRKGAATQDFLSILLQENINPSFFSDDALLLMCNKYPWATYCNLHHTSITDLRPLKAMLYLEFLDLSFCYGITNWEVLHTIPSLKEIYVEGVIMTEETLRNLQSHKILVKRNHLPQTKKKRGKLIFSI
ncbi:MAG: hypothetical protein K2X98_06165 [Alphaproteobacteria bacterium]|nr:hypothetical protein [Alphaproteobacteria bacterium]